MYANQIKIKPEFRIRKEGGAGWNWDGEGSRCSSLYNHHHACVFEELFFVGRSGI